jgi:hypothetical protein
MRIGIVKFDLNNRISIKEDQIAKWQDGKMAKEYNRAIEY